MPQSFSLKSVNARLAEELAVDEVQVAAAVRLLDDGASVPLEPQVSCPWSRAAAVFATSGVA